MTTYGTPQSARNSDNRTERWATAVLVLGIAGLVCFTPIPGIVAIFGSHRAAFGAKRTVGLILGWVQVAAVTAVIVIGTVLNLPLQFLGYAARASTIRSITDA